MIISIIFLGSCRNSYIFFLKEVQLKIPLLFILIENCTTYLLPDNYNRSLQVVTGVSEPVSASFCAHFELVFKHGLYPFL